MKATTLHSSILFGLCFFTILTACKKELFERPVINSDEDRLSAITAYPVGLAISPTSGVANTPVTITNANFGTDQNLVKVSFNDKPARIVEFSSFRIVAEVPLKAGTGPVKVNVNN